MQRLGTTVDPSRRSRSQAESGLQSKYREACRRNRRATFVGNSDLLIIIIGAVIKGISYDGY